LLRPSFPFVFDGPKVAEGRAAARGIEEAFDELKDSHPPRLVVRSEGTSIDQLALQISGGATQEKVEKFGGQTPLGRPGQAAELGAIYVQ
jgi:hypothetical protein